MQSYPPGHVDYPTGDLAVSPACLVTGWVLGTTSATPEVRILVNGKPVATVRPDIARPDVHAAYPAAAANNPTPGFRAHIDLRAFLDQSVRLEVQRVEGGRATQFYWGQQPVQRQLYGHIDFADPGTTLLYTVPAYGWVLSDDPENTEVQFFVNGELVTTTRPLIPRPDVHNVYPHFADLTPNPGICAQLDLYGYLGQPIHLRADVVCGEMRQVIFDHRYYVLQDGTPEQNYVLETGYRRQTPDIQAQKLARILPTLRCPNCYHEDIQHVGDHLACPQCHTTYALLDGAPVMVVGEPEYPVRDDGSEITSNHPDGLFVRQKLSEVVRQGGMALDIGSGSRTYGSMNFIQLEIKKYPFIDVVNQAMLLPFRDNAFDFVMSVAVTEHVKEPWVLIKEIQRVTKPGGTVYVDSAFLQPLHAHPSHYYNMSHYALAELFDEVEVVTLRPESNQHPFYTLEWFLRIMRHYVPPADMARFEALTVAELYEQLRLFTSGRKTWLGDMQLPPDVLEKLAAGYTLVGRKRGAAGDDTPA